MILAAVLIVAITALVAWFVYTDLDHEVGPVFFPHDPRPEMPLVVITSRPHLVDWATDDDLIDFRPEYDGELPGRRAGDPPGARAAAGLTKGEL